MSIEEKIIGIQKSIQENRFTNESSISIGIVLPILGELGWQVFNPGQVLPEYTVRGGRVDFALLDRFGKPIIFIEVKMLGNLEGAEQQLFEYAFHQGVPFLILTDGREWNFYLPLEQGDYLDRKLYKSDLQESNIERIKEKFIRYLDYERVNQGLAYEDAKSDFREISQRRKAERFIPQAWQSIITGNNDTLIKLLIDEVENMCGFRPDRESCHQYLKRIYTNQVIQEPAEITNHHANNLAVSSSNQIGFTFRGQFHNETSARNVLIEILKTLSSSDPTFLDRFYAQLPNGNRRKIISKNKVELYPNRPDFYNDQTMVREFLPGWWIGLNYSKGSIDRIILQVIEFSGLTIGVDINYSIGINN